MPKIRTDADGQILDVLRANGVPFTESDDVADAMADLIVDGRVVGWFQGQAEASPRALAQRSILASPVTHPMHERIDTIKNREQWRPLAPNLSASAAKDYLTNPGPSKVHAGRLRRRPSAGPEDRSVTDDRPRHWPADSHVHSEWSWDAPYASMELACRRAIDLGLPSIAFTEHLDFTARRLDPTVEVSSWQAPFVTDGLLTPPPLDVGGYRESLDRCRTRFPGLRILSGVEIGEPHLQGHRLGPTIARVPFDRVLVSMHTLPSIDGGYTTVDAAFQSTPAAQVLRVYLGEVRAMVETFDQFDVLAHLDYAARYWPADAGPYIVEEFQEEYCAVLTILSAQGKALEVNTCGPVSLSLLRWWYQLGGESITFASDAHRPEQVARGFPAAVALAEAAGFAPGADPHGVWGRDSAR